MDDFQEILDGLKCKGSRWGIGTAASYLRRLAAATGLKGLNVSEADFTKAIEAAERKLTFCDPDMVVVGSDATDGHTSYKLVPMELPEGGVLNVPQPGQKRRGKREPTAGSVMEFDAIMTSSRVDRDGDILEPKGAEVDPKSPLLWQHNPWEPIGKLLEVTKQNSKQVRGRFAIIDSPLGRDAAQLVEFGALRISHGFLPKEWTDRRDKSDEWLGWHITSYEMMEVSLVSVPSNVDAVVTAYDAQKLAHPLTKAWAQSIKETRPVQGKGITLPEEPEGTPEPTPKKETDTPTEPKVVGKCGVREFDGDDVLRYLASDATEKELREAKSIIGYSLERLAKRRNADLVSRILNC